HTALGRDRDRGIGGEFFGVGLGGDRQLGRVRLNGVVAALCLGSAGGSAGTGDERERHQPDAEPAQDRRVGLARHVWTSIASSNAVLLVRRIRPEKVQKRFWVPTHRCRAAIRKILLERQDYTQGAATWGLREEYTDFQEMRPRVHEHRLPSSIPLHRIWSVR